MESTHSHMDFQATIRSNQRLRMKGEVQIAQKAHWLRLGQSGQISRNEGEKE
jgi:hypothetical protein